ncbi:MAG: hypothetical protein AAGH19_11295, partial [Pseudomonadota bacterium]
KPDVVLATHGSWYDPRTDGEGFMLFTAPNGTLSLYYYGYTDLGATEWLVAFSDEEPAWGAPIHFDVFETSGGSFNDFDPDAIDLTPWGSMRLVLNDCGAGRLDVDGPPGEKLLQLTRLADVVGSPCNSEAERTPSQTGSLTGAWYDPVTDGQGFTIHHVAGDRGLAYFFGYRDDGSDLWLVGVWDEPLVFGEPIRLELLEFSGGAYSGFQPDEIMNRTWGTLDLSFEDCRNGEAIMDGLDGLQALDIVLLAGAVGLPCGVPAN